jgi:thiamine kinase-like enzyme
MSQHSQNIVAHLFNQSRLAQLATVVSEERMRELFDQHLHASGVAHEWRVTSCKIERIYFKPAKRCWVLYRLTLSNREGEQAQEWLFGKISRDSSGLFRHPDSALKKDGADPRCLEVLPAVSFWEKLGMELWVFPYESVLTALPEVVGGKFFMPQLEANLSALDIAGSAAGWRCKRFRFDRIKYTPEKRCVLRFHVGLENSRDESHDLTFYSKTYNDSLSGRYFNILRSAREQILAQSAAVHMPKPLAHFENTRTTWYEDWGGAALFDKYSELESRGLVPNIAHTLAALHRCRISGLRRGPDLEDVFHHSSADARHVSHLLPGFRDRIGKILASLERRKNHLQKQDAPSVPVHGAFRLEQILIKENKLALVDFDALALGDPLADVAEFIASLHYLQLSQGMLYEFLQTAAELFYTSYCEAAPWACNRERIGFYALCFFLSKLYMMIKQLDIKALQRLEVWEPQILTDWLHWIS